MRTATLTFVFLILLITCLAGQTHITLLTTKSPNWEKRTFMGKAGFASWEYGIKAVMERPSIQDLITTPVML